MNRLNKIPDVQLSEIELSVRAANCLADLGLLTVGQLARSDGRTLESGRNVGATTLREFIRGCTQQLMVPGWVRSTDVRLNPLSEAPTGFRRLAGPYLAGERWMLELAIAQLGDVPWEVVREDGGLMLYRSTNGFREVAEEGEDV